MAGKNDALHLCSNGERLWHSPEHCPGGSFTLNIPLKPLFETTLKIILIFLKKGVDKKAGFGYYYQRRLSGRDTNGV